MIITKDKLKKHIDKFPDELEIDDVIERLFFIEKIEKRILESENNEVESEEEVKKQMQEWFESNT